MSPTRDSLPVLDVAVMRARPAAALRKRHAAVAADGFLVIRFCTVGRRGNPMGPMSSHSGCRCKCR